MTVPKYSVYRNGADQTAHLLAAGYRRTNEEGGNGPPQLETTDDFVTRMQVSKINVFATRFALPCV